MSGDRVFWVTVVDAQTGEDLPAVKHPRHGLVIPSRPGKEFAVRAILEPGAWRLHDNDWFGIKLFIDGEKAGMRMLQQPAHGRATRLEWTFDNWRDGTGFQFAMRNDGTDRFDETTDSNVGSIEVRFHPAEGKHHSEMHASNGRRDWQHKEALRIARSLNMAGGPKQTNSVLRTVSGRQVRRVGPPSGRPSPARLLEHTTLGSIKLYYDTPQNLEFRGILNPLKNKEHRKFFPDKTKADWRELRRTIMKNQFKSNQKRLTCDLTEDDENGAWATERHVKKEEGGASMTSGFTDESSIPTSDFITDTDRRDSVLGMRRRSGEDSPSRNVRRRIEPPGGQPIILDDEDEGDYVVGD